MLYDRPPRAPAAPHREHELHDLVALRAVAVHVPRDLEPRVLGVVRDPLAEHLGRARVVQLVHVAHAQRQQRVQVVPAGPKKAA